MIEREHLILDFGLSVLQNLTNLYQQLQIDHNPNPLLTQVNYHLSQQPEEADIVHDLLAYLAEKMLQNKQYSNSI